MSFQCNTHGWQHLLNPCPFCNSGLTVITNQNATIINTSNLEAEVAQLLELAKCNSLAEVAELILELRDKR